MAPALCAPPHNSPTVVGLDPRRRRRPARPRSPRSPTAPCSAIIEEVPSYAGAWSGRMGEVIRNAVQLALGGFLTLATRQDADAPKAPAHRGRLPARPRRGPQRTYGRGAARGLPDRRPRLVARHGRRPRWRPGSTPASWRASPSWSSPTSTSCRPPRVAGHTDELESSGRVRQRNLERLARALLTGAPADAVDAAAERADWEPPGALTAVRAARSRRSRTRSTALDPRTLQPTDDVPGLPEGHALAARARAPASATRPAYVAARPARHRRRRRADARRGSRRLRSHRRALRCAGARARGPRRHRRPPRRAACSAADAERPRRPARAGARAARRPAPLDRREAHRHPARWLLHHGRRDAVAEELFVHAQTVRYRVGQLREVYGDRLEDPAFVLDATLALA